MKIQTKREEDITMTVQELLEISKDGFGSFKIYDKKNHKVIYDSRQIMDDLRQLTDIEVSLIKAGRAMFKGHEDVKKLAKIQDRYTYGWDIGEENFYEQLRSLNQFKQYIIDRFVTIPDEIKDYKVVGWEMNRFTMCDYVDFIVEPDEETKD